jgi:hypothetical protein
VKFWIPILVVALASCMGPSCRLDDDPCPGHAGDGCTQASNCSCPLASQVTPALQGTACDMEGTVCVMSDIFSFSCRCSDGVWDCGVDLAPAPDLTQPPMDFSFDLATD